LKLCDSIVELGEDARNLGVDLNSAVSFTDHTNSTYKSSNMFIYLQFDIYSFIEKMTLLDKLQHNNN